MNDHERPPPDLDDLRAPLLTIRRQGILEVTYDGAPDRRELERILLAAEHEAQRAACRALLLDVRLAGNDELEIVLWFWLARSRHFQRVALVLGDPLAEARINMVALSRSAPLRSFVDRPAAERWLLRVGAVTGAYHAVGPPTHDSKPPERP